MHFWPCTYHTRTGSRFGWEEIEHSPPVGGGHSVEHPILEPYSQPHPRTENNPSSPLPATNTIRDPAAAVPRKLPPEGSPRKHGKLQRREATGLGTVRSPGTDEAAEAVAYVRAPEREGEAEP